MLLYVPGATQPKLAGPQARDDRGALNQLAESLTSRLDPPVSPRREAMSRASTGSAAVFVIAAFVLIVAFDAWLGSNGAAPTISEPPDANFEDWFVPPISRLDLPAPPAGVGPIEPVPSWNSCGKRCRRELTVGGVPLSFRVPTRGWEAFGDISINKSIVGPQGAEAIMYWTTIPGDYANPCVDVLGMPVPRTVAELVAEVADAPGTELLAPPSNVRVGMHRGKHVALLVRKDLGCDPGYFFIWHDMEAGALWPSTEVGHAISIWIVDTGHKPIFIAAVTSEQASEQLHQEIGLIVRSIRFEASPAARRQS
ncbi:MAG TPA: hypothetical protein VFA08_12230 [Actinomycetota bacterium]|nr:hypothetical protein [Actinomycetota bacterium]